MVQSRNLFYDGRLTECRTNLEKLSGPMRHDRDVIQLDLAMVHLLAGEPKRAESLLKETRDRFDKLEESSMAEKTLSMWTDDKVRSYAGESYEKILIRAFLALANLLHDGSDAESYTLQLQAKHEEIEQNIAKKNASQPNHRPLPLGFYLRGMLREATHHDYDDAARNYEMVCQLTPDVIPFQWDLHRATHSTHSRPGHGVVYIFALVGRGPYKIEVTEKPTSDALLIADRIISAVGPYQLPPTIAPIKVPDIAIPQNDIDAVSVAINGQPIGPTSTLTDVTQLAVDSLKAERNHTMARAVARRCIKKATIVAAKEKMASDGLTALGMDIAGIAWEASEGADTRCWGLLPSEIQVMRIETQAGNTTVRLTPMQGGMVVGPSQEVQVAVTNGMNTYVLCWFPDSRSTAQVIGDLSSVKFP
jgi:uncharacterized protein